MGRSLQQRIAPKLEVADAIRDHHRNIHRALRLAALLEMLTPAQKLACAALALEGVPFKSTLWWRTLGAINNSNGQGGAMEIAQ